MKHHTTHNRPSHIPYCYPSVLPTKSPRATFAETLPIRSDLSFTLWKDWRGSVPFNEMLFKAWGDLDAVICHRFLQMGNDWRKDPERPTWMVVLEKQPNGNKHLHGIIQCPPEISRVRYALAFKDGFERCRSMGGFVPDIDEIHNEIKWKTYITKYLNREGQPESFQLNRDPQRDEYEFDVRFSPNFPNWKHTEM